MGFVRWVVDKKLKKLMQKTTSPAFDADTDSNEALRERLDSMDDAPSADATTTATVNQVVGHKEDATVSAVGTTKSVVAYLKGLVQEMAQRGTPKMVSAITSSTDLADVVNITDKGVLTGIVQFMNYVTDAEAGWFILTIDGVVVYDNVNSPNHQTISTDSATTLMSTTIPFNHRFSTSLRVQHKVNTGSHGRLYTFVTYTTD